MMPPISSSGMRTAIREMLIETMVKAISREPLSAAAKEPLGPASYRVVGNYDNLLQSLDEDPRRYRQAGPQDIVLVGEGSLHADGAARLVNLIVHQRELSFR
jgi:hypothetical protein